ncbi:MAG: NADAR family protein [Clostridia bacterium]|nr:NADAR family protein [Clostridia bacterium]
MVIEFYRVGDKYGCFSNFSKHSFELDGYNWHTSEHYFQAMKFNDDIIQQKIREISSPMEIAKIGRDSKNPLRSDWESVKDDIMRVAVWNKFSQNEDISEILLSTGDNKIVEKTSDDYYWGCGTKGSGKNMLGIILMETREKLRQNKLDGGVTPPSA